MEDSIFLNEYQKEKNCQRGFDFSGYSIETTGRFQRLLESIKNNPSLTINDLAYTCGFGNRIGLFEELCLKQALKENLIEKDSQSKVQYHLTEKGLSLYATYQANCNDKKRTK